ncbi:TIGR02391 family protein [Hydrogenophaga sp.]|uniref:TIGR02391 family protein n=1 Tax=Hydrogenophaga sp. TaxID=1904254 RepID=UPI0035B32018
MPNAPGFAGGWLLFSEIGTETGRNDQKGFLLIYEGIYTGVRNVKAHSLNHDLNEQKAAQYLVTLSLLARRVEECNDRP